MNIFVSLLNWAPDVKFIPSICLNSTSNFDSFFLSLRFSAELTPELSSESPQRARLLRRRLRPPLRLRLRRPEGEAAAAAPRAPLQVRDGRALQGQVQALPAPGTRVPGTQGAGVPGDLRAVPTIPAARTTPHGDPAAGRFSDPVAVHRLRGVWAVRAAPAAAAALPDP